MHSFSVKGMWRRRACMKNIPQQGMYIWLRAVRLTTIVSNILQFADKRKVSQRKMAMTDRLRGTSAWLTWGGVSELPPIDWKAYLKIVQFLCSYWRHFLSSPRTEKYEETQAHKYWKTSGSTSRSCIRSVVILHFHVKTLLCNYCLATRFHSTKCTLGIERWLHCIPSSSRIKIYAQACIFRLWMCFIFFFLSFPSVNQSWIPWLKLWVWTNIQPICRSNAGVYRPRFSAHEPPSHTTTKDMIFNADHCREGKKIYFL